MRNGPSTPLKRFLYGGFSGLNTSKADIALENKDRQAVVAMDNAFCDWRGFISNERALEKVGAEDQAVVSARWFSLRENDVVYAARTGAGVSLRAMRNGVNEENIWPKTATPANAIFNRKAIFTAAGQAPMVFDGSEWKPINAEDAFGASYCCAVQDRLVLSGFAANPTEIVVSRVNHEETTPMLEAPNDPSVLKAFRFNIQNLIGSAETVAGIGVFDATRLAVFTGERTLIYVADADATKWTLEEKSAINVGTISHNTIAGSAGELLMCSRSGVHSLRRSVTNGTTMFTVPLSEPVAELYRSLVAQVSDKQSISATFDRDAGVYHIMFPVSQRMAYRLSLAIDPTLQEGEGVVGRWSLSTYGGLTCGDFLGGKMLFGSISGFMQMLGEMETGSRGTADVTLPVLWHGDFIYPKMSHLLILYAAGSGTVTFEAEDEGGRKLSTVVFELPEADQVDYHGVPIAKQFTRPFSHQYTGLRLRMKIESDNQVRVFAVGVMTKET